MPSGSRLEYDKKNNRVYVGVSIDYSDKAALIRIAKRKRKTVSELIRTYIVWGIENDD